MTLDITNEAASAAILRVCDEGRLVQGRWHDQDSEGRELACLLGAIDPSVTSARQCNGNLMPMWMAELTPTLFDGIPAENALPIARRYGHAIAHVLAPAQWDRVLTRFLVRAIDVAVDAAKPVSEDKPYWPAVAVACEQVKAALESREGIKEAKEAAAAALAAAEEEGAAAEAARAAGTASASAPSRAAWAAAGAARAAAAEPARTYLSLFTFLLDQIEAEIAA